VEVHRRRWFSASVTDASAKRAKNDQKARKIDAKCAFFTRFSLLFTLFLRVFEPF
jgi:hypothetical protein